MKEIMEIKLKEYEEHFGEPYVFYFGHTKSQEEVIEEITTCIQNNVKQAEPEYDDNFIY